MSFQVFSGPALEVGGGTLKNVGGSTIYYRDEQPVSSTTNDGSLAPGASVTVTGSTWVVTASGATSACTFAPAVATSETAQSGSGLPDGGTAGQLLVKASATDGDGAWTDVRRVHAYKEIGRRGGIYSTFAVAPPEGLTSSMAMYVTVEEARGVSFGWANYHHGVAVPLTPVWVSMQLVTPVTQEAIFPADPVLVPLSFNGQAEVRVAPGGRVFTDPIARTLVAGDQPIVLITVRGEGVLGVLGASIANGSVTSVTGPQLPPGHPLWGRQFYFWVGSEALTAVAGTTGTAWTVVRGTGATSHSNGATVSHCIAFPVAYPTQTETESHDWLGYFDLNQGDLDDSGLWVSGAQHLITSPEGMRATIVTPSDVTVVSYQGDSNSNGHGDDDQPKDQPAGFADRACTLVGVPSVKMAMEGAALESWTADAHVQDGVVNTPDFYWTKITEYGATVHIIALGTNRGGEAGSTLYSRLLDNCRLARAYGADSVIVCTIPPATDPGDTPDVGDDNRIDFHALIRAGDELYDWVADVVTAVAADGANDRDIDGQFWYVDPDDGVMGTNLHYATPGHAAAAVVLADALTHVIAGDVGGISQASWVTPPAPSAPVNTGAPALTGTAQTGNVLSCTLGTWTGYPVPTRTREWKRNGTVISTSTTYTLVEADEGTTIKCTVTATNTQGSASADSNTVTPTAAPSSTPPDDLFGSDLFQWQDETGLSGFADTATITSWDDLSISGVNDMAPSAATGPVCVAAGKNGKKIARFTTNNLARSFASALPQPFEVFMVCRQRTVPDGATVRLFWTGFLGGVAAWSTDVSGGDRRIRLALGNNLDSSSNTNLPSTWHAWRFAVNGASSAVEVDGTTSVVTGDAGSGTLDSLTVGRDWSNNYAEIDIGEIVIVKRTTTADERTALQGYFAAKWGL